MVNELFIAKDIKDAVSYMKRGSTLLAGGTEINRLDSSVKAKSLVSIGRVEELSKIAKISSASLGKCISIGAMCTFQDVLESALVPEYLKQSCAFMSSRVKRNMATVGGNIALRRDDSYLIATLLACDAVLEIVSKSGKKTAVSCEDYVLKADKYKDVLIYALLIPSVCKNIAEKRYANTASSHGYITMAVCKNKSDFKVGLCVKNSGIYVFNKLTDFAEVSLKDDMFGSKAYKKYLLGVTQEDLVKVLGGSK